ncbi:MAG: DUF262 domain-containing protein [Bradyrhizobiaceae bacterium]|nr:MAG: DUF262 domain-containing protein [Bradyrhizobiaceae bacterium]
MADVEDDDVEDFVDENRTLAVDIKYKITSFGADFLVDGLVDRFKNGDIYVPDFQRSFVWTKPQASRFLESILLGLPIPGIFLFREEDTNKMLVVDGLQRLSSLTAFLTGKFPDTDKTFRLENVSERFEGKAFADLEPEDKRQINNTIIHATIFQQSLPSDDDSSVYLIFERLNTGGTPLQPQEIRAALYHGPFSDFLSELNEIESWRKIFGRTSRRRKDEELILRFLAFLYSKENYQSPMVRFLNRFMSANRHLTKLKKKQVSEQFEKTFNFIYESLGSSAFRPSRSLNAAVLDAVATTVAKHQLYDELTPKQFATKYNKLLRKKGFQEAISTSTADESVVDQRFTEAEKTIV